MELEDYMEPEKKQVISDWNPSASFEPVEMIYMIATNKE